LIVKYTPAEKSAFESQMKGSGPPDLAVERITAFITDIKNGQEPAVNTGQVQEVFGLLFGGSIMKHRTKLARAYEKLTKLD
jgi:hypothetical protein